MLLPALAGLLQAGDARLEASASDIWQTVGLTLAKVTTFIVLMLVVGRRVLPKALWWVARTGSRELFTLSVVAVAVAVGVAFGAAQLFDVSFALGAFFAGMMMRESEFSHRAADESLPLRDAFAVLFFVSVGMLFDLAVIWQEPIKPLAGALISIALNSALFAAVEPAQRWMRERSAWARRLEQRDDPLAELPMSTDAKMLSRQVVLVGYGRVGRRIAQTLGEQHIPYAVAEQNREIVDALRKQGVPAVFGDAQTAEVLIQAHISRAAVLVVAISHALDVRKMVEIGRTLNPALQVALRSHNVEEAALLQSENLGTVFGTEEELARGMAGQVPQLVQRLRPTLRWSALKTEDLHHDPQPEPLAFLSRGRL